jgi:hypothetical protein
MKIHNDRRERKERKEKKEEKFKVSITFITRKKFKGALQVQSCTFVQGHVVNFYRTDYRT